MHTPTQVTTTRVLAPRHINQHEQSQRKTRCKHPQTHIHAYNDAHTYYKWLFLFSYVPGGLFHSPHTAYHIHFVYRPHMAFVQPLWRTHIHNHIITPPCNVAGQLYGNSPPNFHRAMYRSYTRDVYSKAICNACHVISHHAHPTIMHFIPNAFHLL